jgi:hypothetical protein
VANPEQFVVASCSLDNPCLIDFCWWNFCWIDLI